MSYKKRFLTSTCATLLLISCGAPPLGSLQPIETTPASNTPAQTQENVIEQYLMNLSTSFTIQSIQTEHEDKVATLVKSFESDLESGNMEDYYDTPGFSIKLLAGSEGNFLTDAASNSQLLAGSEGNFFNTNVDLSQTVSSEASFAQALVIYDDQTSATFKGQLVGQTFYFAGDENITSANTTYLVTLDQDLQSQVLQGELINNVTIETPAASASPTATPTATPTPTPSPTATPSASETAFPFPPEGGPPPFPPPPGQEPFPGKPPMPGQMPPPEGQAPHTIDPFAPQPLPPPKYVVFGPDGRFMPVDKPPTPPPNIRERYGKALNSFAQRKDPYRNRLQGFQARPAKALPPLERLFDTEYRREYDPIIAQVIGFNTQELERLKQMRQQASSQGQATAELDAQIANKEARLSELKQEQRRDRQWQIIRRYWREAPVFFQFIPTDKRERNPR